MFHPRMQNRIEGISVREDLRWKAWNGALADLWTVACAPGARGEYVSEAPRLVVILDQEGEGGMDVALSPEDLSVASALPAFGTMCYVPAGVPVWSRVGDMHGLRHVDIHFDMDALKGRFGGAMNREAIGTPRLGFRDDRLLGLARLIAAECATLENVPDLYGDSMIAAVVAVLWPDRAPDAPRRARAGLPPGQLRRVTEFLETNCVRTIRLQELAELTGLSPSYFCAAFKAATGMPPHKWQMRARIARAKTMIAGPAPVLAEVAVAVGFADQAHLTRVFRQVEGTTPAAWARARIAA